MRILFIPHRIPFPPNKGDKIRSFHLLAHLSKRHEVHVAALVDDPDDLRFVGDVQERTQSFVFEMLNPRRKPWAAMLSLLFGKPITVRYFYSKRLQERIDTLIDSAGIEAVFCFSSPMAEYVFRSRQSQEKKSKLKWVMDLIDVDSCKWMQYAEQSPWWKAWLFRLEARRLADYERSIGRAFDNVLLVTDEERRYLPRGQGMAEVTAVSNGVDLEFFAPRQGSRDPGQRPTIVFTGVMDYFPNVEGVRWFAERILPLVRSSVGDARFVIVGTRPAPEVLRLARIPDVDVTGFVPDVRDYLDMASVCIAPLRIARGIQNKVLEAMAMAKAVVTTSQALEGIRAEPGRDVLVADSEESFAAQVVALLRDPAAADRLGRNARECVETRYSWSANLAVLDEIFPLRPAA